MTLQTQQNAEEARSHRSELQRALQSLDIALSRLERANRALAFAQEAADKAYRFKSDFVANVSHELRTPLASIIGFIETLRGPALDDAPARAQFLEIMDQQAREHAAVPS